MKKDIEEYLSIVSDVSVVDAGWIAESLEEYANTVDEHGVDQNAVEYMIADMAEIYKDIEDENEIFDRTQTAEAKALLQAIVSDLEDYQEKVDREYEEEREAMNRAYRNAKGFN